MVNGKFYRCDFGIYDDILWDLKQFNEILSDVFNKQNCYYRLELELKNIFVFSIKSSSRHLGHQERYLPTKRGFHQYFGAPNCHFGPYNDKTTPNIPVFHNDVMIGRLFIDQFS